MKKILFIVAMLLVLLLVYTRWLKSVATIQSLKQIENQIDSVFNLSNSANTLTPELFDLSKEKTFLATKVSLLKSDSISLIINLVDSTLNLYFKGVILQSTKVNEFEVDDVLLNLNPITHLSIVSQALYCTEKFHSIEKEPIIVKKAPANEKEAIASITLPDSIKKEPVFIWYEAGSNLELLIVQDQVETKKQKVAYKKFQKYYGKAILKQQWFNVSHPKQANYKPKIQVWINHSDAMTFYRALPFRPQVVIRY